VGLLYRNGYFQQYLTADGWQQEAYPELDFYNLAIEPLRYTDGSPVHVRVDLPDNAVFCKVWKANVGRIPLYLLDTNLQENSRPTATSPAALRRRHGDAHQAGDRPGHRRRARAGGAEHQPTVFHMNEGHSAFLALERIRMLLENSPLTFDEARQQVMATNVFTTHTPVPAGIDTFSPEMMLKYFKPIISRSSSSTRKGSWPWAAKNPADRSRDFPWRCWPFAWPTASTASQRLHGDVSRKMWHNVWPQVPPDDVPIRTSPTAFTPARGWQRHAFILDRYLSSKWQTDPTDQSSGKASARFPTRNCGAPTSAAASGW
jgi:glycogen phosphorylase